MLLLDTCCVLWLVAEHQRFREATRALIERHAGRLYVSAISAFEVGIKSQRGALRLPLPAGQWWTEALAFHGLREVPVSGTIAARSTQLPALHADPCDRILIATAQERRLQLITPDSTIARYPDLQVVW